MKMPFAVKNSTIKIAIQYVNLKNKITNKNKINDIINYHGF